jgi:hypothetical protein
MKKHILLSVLMVGACTLMTQAQTQPGADNAVKTENAIQEKMEIKADALPEAVKKTLASDEYKGWEVSKAYDAKGTYEVELKKGAETKTVKFDKDGKVVK